MRASRTLPQGGFTLLEILVALVVLGFLMLALGQGVGFGLTAWNRQSRASEARGELDAVDRALRGLVANIDPGTPIASNTVHGGPDRVAFTSELPRGASQIASREADMLLLVDADHRLILRWTPHRHALRLAPPRLTDTELLRDVERIELSYQGADGAGGWVRSWSAREPPALIRIRLLFPPVDPRRWPDVVAAPMRDMSTQ